MTKLSSIFHLEIDVFFLLFRLFFSLVAVCLMAGNLFAGEVKSNQKINTKLYTLEAETLLTGLKHPWCIAFLPDGTSFVTEREGNLILVDNSFRIKKNISLDSIPIYARGQGGLFDIAIDQVNQSEYGLQAGIFSDSLDEINRAFNNIEVGGLIVNDVPTFRVDHMPYGGVKSSGLGREGIKYTMKEMLEPKLMVRNYK